MPDPAATDPVVVAVQKVLPAVVNLSTEQLVSRQGRDPFEDFWRQFFGQPRRPQNEGQSLGSGVIVDEDGWIVTNYHVVRRANRIHIVRADGVKTEARYVSGDESNDLALLKIDAKEALPYVEIATEREPLLGETVIAVGNPFGLEHTVTKGIISAKSRTYDAGEVQFNDILQTDASINPGNSGGPLINTRGELVGINMAILSQAQGIGFAIPAKRVAAMLANWLTPEKRARLWFGATFAREAGKIVVVEVQPGSPAGRVGLQARDVVVKLDGQQFTDILRLQRHLIHKKAAESAKLEVVRAGKPLSFDIQMAALPKASATDLMRTKFGLQVQEMSADLAEALGIPPVPGLLIAEVEKESAAAAAGLRRGLVITHVAGEEVQSLDRLAEQLMDLKSGNNVTMALYIVQRRGNLLLQQTASVTLKAR